MSSFGLILYLRSLHFINQHAISIHSDTYWLITKCGEDQLLIPNERYLDKLDRIINVLKPDTNDETKAQIWILYYHY